MHGVKCMLTNYDEMDRTLHNHNNVERYARANALIACLSLNRRTHLVRLCISLLFFYLILFFIRIIDRHQHSSDFSSCAVPSPAPCTSTVLSAPHAMLVHVTARVRSFFRPLLSVCAVTHAVWLAAIASNKHGEGRHWVWRDWFVASFGCVYASKHESSSLRAFTPSWKGCKRTRTLSS